MYSSLKTAEMTTLSTRLSYYSRSTPPHLIGGAWEVRVEKGAEAEVSQNQTFLVYTKCDKAVNAVVMLFRALAGSACTLIGAATVLKLGTSACFSYVSMQTSSMLACVYVWFLRVVYMSMFCRGGEMRDDPSRPV